MENRTRNLWLFLGLFWTIIWTILVLLGVFGFYKSLIYEVPGIIFLAVALYNWDSGKDIEHMQTTPIENESLEANAGAR